MIARPSKNKTSSKTTLYLPLYSKVANDNYSPKKNTLGWILLIAGLSLSLGTAFWIYERIM